MPHLVRIWDLPTRLFHWLLALGVIALVTTAQLGYMEWHFRLGYAVLALLIFRLLWGLFGGRWSRFTAFIYSPASLWRYLRGQGDPSHSLGHSPTGALSVFALLFFLLAQIGTGLFSDDEIAASGPLTRLASSDFVSLASWYHREVGKRVLIVLVILHVIAILYYLWRKRQNLVRPMLTGDKELAQPAPASRDDARSRLVAAVLLLLSAAGVTLFLWLTAP
ncbi:MAG: cytochrome b/b6 domain-containing protein [Burkholderiales bacterium]|nr:cytochrome b/b6 domain-containing protein [Burkholderiales bacterium]